MAETNNFGCWEEMLDNFTKSYKKWHELEEKFLIKMITPNSSVLDIGCGDGRTLKYLLKITSHLSGIDNDSEAVKDCKKNILNANIKLAEARALPFDIDSFDFVLCLGTFTNLGKDKEKSVSEMKRVLKKGGFIIATAYSEDSLNERLEMYKKSNIPVKKVKGTTVIFDFEKNNVSEQFTGNELKEIFIKFGLKLSDLIKVDKIGYIIVVEK